MSSAITRSMSSIKVNGKTIRSKISILDTVNLLNIWDTFSSHEAAMFKIKWIYVKVKVIVHYQSLKGQCCRPMLLWRMAFNRHLFLFLRTALNSGSVLLVCKLNRHRIRAPCKSLLLWVCTVWTVLFENISQYCL